MKAVPPISDPNVYSVLVLPETVLFPKVTMTVALIEEREHLLVEDLVAGLTPGREVPPRLVFSLCQWDSQYAEKLLPNPIATLAELTDWELGGAYERRIELKGIERVELGKIVQQDPFVRARVEPLGSPGWSRPTRGKSLSQATEALRKQAQNLAFGKDEPAAKFLLNTLEWITDPGVLADYVAHHLVSDWYLKQEILEMVDPAERVQALLEVLGTGKDRLAR